MPMEQRSSRNPSAPQVRSLSSKECRVCGQVSWKTNGSALQQEKKYASFLIRRCYFKTSLVVHGQKKSMVILDLQEGWINTHCLLLWVSMAIKLGLMCRALHRAAFQHHHRCSLAFCRQLCCPPRMHMGTLLSNLCHYGGCNPQLTVF